MSQYHIPVMLKEVLDLLAVQKDRWYIDCNLGGGGHSEAVLERGGKVIGIDLDPDSIREVAKKHALTIQTINNHLEARSDNLILVQSNFINLKNVIANARDEERRLIASAGKALANRHPEFHKRHPERDNRHPEASSEGSKDSSPSRLRMTISGILFDLGVSSYQLETPGRGFSFNTAAPLDMRMDQSLAVSAADLVNGLHESELAELFWKLGEENFARPIAKKIVQYRQTKKIATTDELANIILSIRHKSKGDRTHPATRVFQALRIAVNDELNSLKDALPQAFDILKPGGRLVCISFHSLEDRIVKNLFKEKVGVGLARSITKKPIIPTDEEVDINPRSRSGKLRVIEKI